MHEISLHIRFLLSRYRQFLIYCIIGCTGAGLDFILFWLLSLVGGMHYQIANFISISCGIVNNFFLNRRFNFKSRDRTLIRLASFYAVGMLGWGVSAGLLYVLITCNNFDKILSKVMTIFVITIMQYLLNKTISFRKSEKESSCENSNL